MIDGGHDEEALRLEIAACVDYLYDRAAASLYGLDGDGQEGDFLLLADFLKGKGYWDASHDSRYELALGSGLARAAYRAGMEAYGDGRALEAVRSLDVCRAYGAAYAEATEVMYGLALAAFKADHTDRATSLIKGHSFEEAKGLVAVLAEYFPDDPRTQNLISSCWDVEAYDGVVLHIFYHPLIAYPERAFRTAAGYNMHSQEAFFTTVHEFKESLRQLHEKGYCLVDINDLYDAEFDGTGRTVSVTRKPVYVPKGKKPLIISIDDMNYYEYMVKDGQVTKLVLGEGGDVLTHSTDMAGNAVISGENEIVPILDAFVREHPDFSMNNAKGCIALTGFYGILGYRTDEPAWAGYDDEVAGAREVVARLKETGWTFASHSQGHRHTAAISLSLLVNDTDRWAREVLPLVGPTSVYIYPYGERVAFTDPKFDYLKASGFAYFGTVSSDSGIVWGKDYLEQGRRAVDGIAMRDMRLRDIFHVPSLIDPIRPSYAQWAVWARANGYL
ncbi:MAG: hypothetical protein FWE70_02605, partial [Oscillospiraceae bacterium]|nr:hypothetical protein [Oscillospiraceae bacterium]